MVMAENIDKSPLGKAVSVISELKKDIIFKVPSGIPRKRQKQKVLDEESYVEEMGKIIQRDFFPDLEKLKAQNEYLDALEKNDMIKIKELNSKYSGKSLLRERLPSPATFETPANIHNSQHIEEPNLENKEDDQQSDKTQPKFSLDQYLNHHTSQDNQSFEEIMIESENKHRQKYSYLYNEEDKSEEEREKQLALPSIEEQCALPEKKLCVDTWSYKNKNYIMYIPDGVGLTPEQELEMKEKRREILYNNTRLKQNPFNEVQSKETIHELAKTQAKVLDGKIGVDGKEIVKSDTPQINGFSFVRSPSPYPGVAESPLMTWGEIEGTPFRLDGSDTPLPRSQGPSFKMAEPPRREQLALALAEKVGEKHRDQKKRAMDAARKQFQSPSPRPHSSTIDRLATMSPAARKLAEARLKLSSGSDSALRASYSPSPLLKSPRTPGRITTPKLSLGIKRHEDINVNTDNLLQINVPKRKTASDFF